MSVIIMASVTYLPLQMIYHEHDAILLPLFLYRRQIYSCSAPPDAEPTCVEPTCCH